MQMDDQPREKEKVSTAGGVRVEVMLFARAAEIVGARRFELDLPPASQVKDLSDYVTTHYPQLADLAPQSRWADATRFLDGDEPLQNGQVVAMIPPVSGG